MTQVIKKIKVGDTEHPIEQAFYLSTSTGASDGTGLSTVAGNGSSGSYKSVRWYIKDVAGIAAPYDGMRIAVKVPLNGVSTAGVILSINGDTDADYHPVAYNINTVLTSHFPQNTIKVFTYDASQTMTCYKASNTAVTVTGVWKADANYDSNTTVTYGTLEYYFRPYNGANALYRYKFCMLDKDNRIVPLTTTNVANGTAVTNQTPTSVAFRPDKIWWYCTTTTINAGALLGGQTLWRSGYNANNATNGGMAICNFNSTIGTYKLIYLCGTYNKTTGLFSLRGGGTASSTQYYTQVPTNTANITLSSYFTSGYDYILLGGTYSSNNYIQLFDNNPMFHFDGTNLAPYDSWASGTVKSVNNVSPDSNGNVSLSIPDDSNLVHKTGTETISGDKTFNDTITLSGTGGAIVTSSGSTIQNNVVNSGMVIENTGGGYTSYGKTSIGGMTDDNNIFSLSFPAKTGTLATTDQTIQDITTQDVRITSLETGIYRLTYNGNTNIKYNGSSGTDNYSVITSSSSILLYVNKSIVGAPVNNTFWAWKIYQGTLGAPVIAFGTTTTSSGSYETRNLSYLTRTLGSTTAAGQIATFADTSGTLLTNSSTKVSDLAVDSDVVHKGTSSSSVAETVYGTKTFYDSVIASTSTSSTGSWLGNDGTLTLKKGSGPDSPAYIDFTGVSGNSGTIRLKSSNLSSGTKTITIPAKDGTLLTDADLVSADNLVTTDGVQTITGRKTFSLAPVMNGIWDSTKNSTIATFSYSSGTGSYIISSGHFIANGDDDSGINKPTDNTGASDLDTLYCNTGITLTDADGEIGDIKLAFPQDSGTFLTNYNIAGTRASSIAKTMGGDVTNRNYGVEIDSSRKMFVDVPWNTGMLYCNTGAITAAKTAECEGFMLSASSNKWYIMRVNYGNTTTSALTLNVNGTGAKTLYINGTSTPGENFVSGTYIGYYNGYWYFYSLITSGQVTSQITPYISNATGTTRGLVKVAHGYYGGSLARNWSGWISFGYTFSGTPTVVCTWTNTNANLSNYIQIKSITTTGFYCVTSAPSGAGTNNNSGVRWLAIMNS